jgi:hypothetical protein
MEMYALKIFLVVNAFFHVFLKKYMRALHFQRCLEQRILQELLKYFDDILLAILIT